MPRFTIDVDERFIETLNGLVQTSSANNKAEVIRNAVALYSVLKKEAPVDGGVQKVTIEGANGNVTRVIVP